MTNHRLENLAVTTAVRSPPHEGTRWNYPVSVPARPTALGAKVRGDGSARHGTANLKRMASGTTLVLGGVLVWQASNFLFNAVGAHVLGPGRYGVLAASMALLSFATPLLTAVQSVASREATSLAANKHLGKVEAMLCHYGLRVTVGALLLGGITAATSSWISRLFNLGSPWLVVIIGATVPCYVVGHLLGGLLQGVERFGRFALESVVEGTTKAILGILAMGLLWHSPASGLGAVIASSIVGLATYLLLTVPLLYRNTLSVTGNNKFTERARDRGTHRQGHGFNGDTLSAFSRDRGIHRRDPRGENLGVARYSVTALATYGLLALLFSSDTLIAKHYLSNHQAGLYAGASLAGKISYFAASSLFVVTFPLFSRHHDQGIEGRKWIFAASGLVFAITAAIVAFFALEPAWVIGPLLGERYRAVEGYIPWIAAVFGLYALGYLVSTYLLARARKGIIVVLAAAVIVQFAGFFAFHSTITSIIKVSAIAFATLICGGVILIVSLEVENR